MDSYTPAQIWIRGFVYLAIAIATETLSILSDGGPTDISMAGVKVTIAGLLTLRAYLDKTPSRSEEEVLNRTPEVKVE